MINYITQDVRLPNEPRLRRRTPVKHAAQQNTFYAKGLGDTGDDRPNHSVATGFARVPIPTFASFGGTLVLRTSESTDTTACTH